MTHFLDRLRAGIRPDATLRTAARQFSRDEDGVATIFAIFMLMMMLLVGGLGVDLMRNEMERVRLQNTVDRAVLAAADRDQTLDPKAVVEDYFAKVGMSNYLTSVQVNEALNFRTVTATAKTVTPTQFMSMVGVDELPVPAFSAAEERVPKVEISLVLDISGSMKDNSKLLNMQTAAKAFLDKVLTPSTKNNISVSLVPYSEQVNVGPDIFDALWVDTRHQFSHCIDFPDGHFVQTQMTPGFPWDQTQHFQWNYYSIESGNQLNTMYDTVCPRNAFERVIPISQNKTQLKAQIDQLQPRSGTAIYAGMKWATALLDPSFREVTVELVGKAKMEGVFGNRPVNYDDEETLKTIVLMTDGQNSDSSRISNWAYNSDSEYAHWAQYNFNYYLNHYVNSKQHHQYHYKAYTAAKGDTLLDKICDAAKTEGIVIWGVGFETTDHGASTLRSCATSPSHFFRVSGTELTTVFERIAMQINQLRLIQ